MRKIIKRKIHISTHKRDLIDFINDEFYSHDKHNAFIEFTMKSLPTDNIIALFYFQKTKRYVETKAFVDGDKFTIEFDTSLINTDETVLGFIYFEKVAQSADVHRFSFGVKVSEIDKLHDIPIEEAKTKRVVAIEDIVTKTELDELFKRIEKNGGTYNDTEIRSSITSIEARVQTLEAKTDKDTVYDDSDVKNRLSTLESNSSRYLTEHQPLTSVEERIQQVEARFNNLSNIYLSSHQSLEHLATKDALGKIEQRVEQLEQNRVSDNHDFITRQELEGKHYLTSVPDELINKISALENKQVVTQEELEAKHYLTSVPEEYAKKSELYNDSALSERVSLLEAKAIANGAYDDKPLLDKIRAIEEQFRNASNLYLQSHQSLEHLVTKKDLEDKHYLTSIPEEYAKKTDLYNDSELRNKITQLETNSVTKEKVESVENRVQALENKSVVTHEELESAGYAKKTELYNDSELREKITALETNSVTHSELASKNYLVEHQPLTDYATNSKVEAVESRVLALENKPAVVPHGYDDSALSGRVSALEAKQDKDTVYDDEEIKRRLTTLEGKTDNFITGVSVNKEGSNVTLTYNYVDGQTKNVSFTDSDTVNVAYDDSGLKQRITNLENRPQVEAYNDADIKQRLTALENNHVTKEQLHEATELDETQFVSPEELEAKHYLTAQQAESVYAKKSELYNDSALASRVSALESKQDNDTVYNDTEIKQRLTNLENRPQVDLTDYAKKSEIPQAYNDSELRGRVSALEHKEDKDTIYNDEEIKRRLTTLEAKPTVDVSGFAKKTEVPTVDSVNNLLRTQGEQATKITALEAKSAYEIHGTGMPNGQVSAPIGTTYVDMAVTNGALKWIKRSGTGNTGWQVFTGDTGWRTLPLVNKRGNARLQVRRINDQVIVKFDGLSWGWFGVDDVSKQEQQANISDKTIGGKKYTWIRLNVGRGNFVLPEGFRSASSLLSGLYGDLGDLLGSVYVGGTADSDALQLRYAMERKALTSNILSQIRISPITFITDDNWPTTLP